MTDGFVVTTGETSITVETEAFTIEFEKENCGIGSFRYKTGDVWHECTGQGTTPPILMAPYFFADALQGDYLYPSGGSKLDTIVNTPWAVRISQEGYLRNISIPSCEDFNYQVDWLIWPSGRIACTMKFTNTYGSNVMLNEEAYRLNPVNDPDITLDRDKVPNLFWFGFYSNNTGSDEDDFSCDCEAVSYQVRLANYGTSGNTNRIYKTMYLWMNDTNLYAQFLLALSVYGSFSDCANSIEFQSRGDALSADLLHPDPLNGSLNAGEVITGSPVNGGFSNDYSAYQVRV
ncbi:MAG: hypothetical protein NTY09_07605 [bacterium]|nr:hypothetical protein [bacterium]